jgi:ubiquinone/menaquinone biosynthesis C-methylase UbiE
MAFEELKQRQAAVWGSAPFENIASTLADLYQEIIAAVEAGSGDRWLDVGCGTGELAFLAAETGADVRGSDLAPNLVATAARQAAERGLDIPFDVADVEALPYDDGSYDVVTSCVGAIFAPDHAQTAAELARVTASGGRLALTAWTPDGAVGDMFRALGSFAPPPPPGAGVPLQWGSVDYAASLLGDAFDLTFTHLNAPWTGESAEEAWAEFRESFGPVKTLRDTLEPDRTAELDGTFLGLLRAAESDDGSVSLDREYILIRGVRL